jgi:hypothetical protein
MDLVIAVMLLNRVRKEIRSNLSGGICYPFSGFQMFSQSLQYNNNF